MRYFGQAAKFRQSQSKLMNMDCDQQVVEVKRLSKQLEENGFARDPDTEDWIDQRRQAKREGRRR